MDKNIECIENNVIIRKMTADDYDGVYALWLKCKGIGLNDVEDTREGITKLLERNPDTCYVAEYCGIVVGSILIGHDGRRGHIYHAAVAPEFRRMNIGRRLVEASLDSLKNECGIAKVTLVAFERNTDGNAFWESMGFTVREDLVYRDKVLVKMTRHDV